MIDAQAGVAGKGVPEIFPERIDPLARIKRPQRVGPALRDQAAVGLAHLRPELPSTTSAAREVRRAKAAAIKLGEGAFCSAVIRLERPGVSTVPGLSTLIRMPRPFRSAIQLRAKERTAALLALYIDKDGKPFIEAIDPVRITDALTELDPENETGG